MRSDTQRYLIIHVDALFVDQITCFRFLHMNLTTFATSVFAGGIILTPAAKHIIRLLFMV